MELYWLTSNTIYNAVHDFLVAHRNGSKLYQESMEECMLLVYFIQLIGYPFAQLRTLSNSVQM